MAKGKLVKKGAFEPKKGKFYYIKNGSIFETTPARGGKKGRKTCTSPKKKTAKKRAAPKKKSAPKRRPAARKNAAKKRATPKKRAAPKRRVAATKKPARQKKVLGDKTIISPQATSILNGGLFYENGKFVDKNKNKLDNNWVKYVYWSNQNSRYGAETANLRTAQFLKEYGIK
jgi:hypothetical protein